jgi:hypothetical protein
VHHAPAANAFFTALTLAADGVVVAAACVALGGVVPAGRRLRRALVQFVGPQAWGLALVVAVTATVGSLYYSEVVGFVPCELCWYQRICMYPLVVVLAVGVLRRDTTAWWCAAPLVGVGVPLATYHWLVERVPSIASTSSCSVGAPCTVPYFEELGFVTLAFMALSAFALVAALLATDRAWRRTARVGPS